MSSSSRQKDPAPDWIFPLGGLIEAYQNTQLPTNSQLRAILARVSAHLPKKPPLSPDGLLVLQDVDDMLDSLRDALPTTNENNEIQHFIWRTRDVEIPEPQQGLGGLNGTTLGDDIKAGKKRNRSAQQLRCLLRFIITNPKIHLALSTLPTVASGIFSPPVPGQSTVGTSKTVDQSRESHARYKEFLSDIHRDEDTQEVIRWLIQNFRSYCAREVASSGKGKQKAEEDTNPFTSDSGQCVATLEAILEHFAEGKSMQDIKDAIKSLILKTGEQRALISWLDDVELYYYTNLLDSNYDLSPTFVEDSIKVVKEGIPHLTPYRTELDALFKSIGTWFDAVGKNTALNGLYSKWDKLLRDVLINNVGRLTFKVDLFSEIISNILFPMFVGKDYKVAIPPITFEHEDSFTLTLSNLDLQGFHLGPKNYRVNYNHGANFSSRVSIKLKNILAEIRGAKFQYRKTGVLNMQDAGVVDVSLAGDGLSIAVELVSTPHLDSSVFRIESVVVKIDKPKLTFRNSNHNWVYKAVRRLLTKRLKGELEQILSARLMEGFTFINRHLVFARDWLESTKASDGADIVKRVVPRDKKNVPTLSPKPTSSKYIIKVNKHMFSTETTNTEKPASAVEPREGQEGWNSKVFNLPPE